MITVYGDYYITIETNPCQYVVRRGKGEKTKKNGWHDDPIGYFNSLASAIKFIRKQVIANGLSEASGCLADALHMVRRINDDFTKTLEGCGLA